MKVATFLDVKQDPVSLLETVQDKIIINDGSQGVRFLNDRCAIMKEISLGDALSITQLYKNISQNQIILYCPDNKLLFHMRLHDYAVTTIPLSDELMKERLCRFYYWDDALILASSNHFYTLDLVHKKIITLQPTDVQASQYQFYKLWEHFKDSSVVAFEQFSTLVTLHDDTFTLQSFDVDRHTQSKLSWPKASFHFVGYGHNKILFVGDQLLEVIELSSHNKQEIKAQKPYVFTAACPIGPVKHAAVCYDPVKEHTIIAVYGE